jgi:hypothetical protein
MRFRRTKHSQSGFLLPLMAAGLLALGSAATVVVVRKENTTFWQPKTESMSDLSNIKAALVAYQRDNHKLPCVAPRGGAPTGISLADCTVAGAGTVRINTGGIFVHIGALPHITLKMGATAGEDKWANRYSYAVVESLTNPLTYTTGAGSIVIQNNGGTNISTIAAFVVISHGPDGKGAYSAKGGNVGKACTATQGKDRDNCLDNDAIFRTADLENAAGASFYDDLITYDVVDAYAQTINKPCMRATVGDASWDTAQCTNNSWTDMMNSGSQAISNTNLAGATGTVTLGCNNGTLTYTTPVCNANCVGPLPAQIWDVTHSCSGTPAGSLNHGANQSVNNVVAGRSGSVTVTCNDGVLNQSSPVCTPSNCTNTVMNWGAGCSANSGAVAHGAAPSIANTAGGYSGSETVTCSYGSFTPSAQVCNASCTGTTHNWGAACTANSTTSAHGAAPSITNTTGGYTGSNTLLCTNGAWSSTGSSCAAGAVNGVCNNAVALGCSAGIPISDNGQTACSTTRQWVCQGSGGGSNSGTCSKANTACADCTSRGETWNTNCSGTTPAITHGNSSSVPNTAVGYTGTVTMSCSNGTLSQSGASCAVVSGCPSESFNWGTDCEDVGAASPEGTCLRGVCICDGLAQSETYKCVSGSWVSVATSSNFCFLGHTQITLEDGSKVRVDRLKAGDRIRAQDGINVVSAIPTRSVDEKIYSFNSGKAFVTGGHPFWTKDGWKAVDPSLTPKERHNVESSKLEVGDALFLEDGSKFTIESIQSEEGRGRTVYSPMVDGDHTYYANTFLVHNKNFAACAGDGGVSPVSCPSTNCASRAETWNTNCTGTTPALADGASTSVTNAAAGYTGSVTMSCSGGTLSQSGASCAASGSCTAYRRLCDTGPYNDYETACTASGGTPQTQGGSGIINCFGNTEYSYNVRCCGGSCPSASQSWTVSGYTCTANTSVAANGADATANDTVGPNQGSATFACDTTLAASPNAGATCGPFVPPCGPPDCDSVNPSTGNPICIGDDTEYEWASNCSHERCCSGILTTTNLSPLCPMFDSINSGGVCSGSPCGTGCLFTDNQNCDSSCVADGNFKTDIYGPDKPRYQCSGGVMNFINFADPGWIPPVCP